MRQSSSMTLFRENFQTPGFKCDSTQLPFFYFFSLFSWPRAEVTNHTRLMPNLSSAEIDNHTHIILLPRIFIEVTDYT